MHERSGRRSNSTAKEARELLGQAESAVKRILKEMSKDGLLIEDDARKNRRYLKVNL